MPLMFPKGRWTTVCLLSALAFGQSETVLYHFSGGADGGQPFAHLIADSAGNFYGTTSLGGSFGGGTVYKLAPSGQGNWTESVLHSFGGTQADGRLPYGGVVRDAAGNLYGTTLDGGAYNGGTAYELSPNSSGAWTESILHNFGKGSDGLYPQAGLIADSQGNLYGTTYEGGANTKCLFSGLYYSCGIVFELTNIGSGWSEKTIHNFGGSHDGYFSVASLTFDVSGNLYGTTTLGGQYQLGVAFELAPTSQGWQEHILHNFGKGNIQETPQSGLVLDNAGNLYGTTFDTVFQLTHTAAGWSDHAIHIFKGSPDGTNPGTSLWIDAAGNVYGGTNAGGKGCNNGCGIAFELSPVTGAPWKETVLHDFSGGLTDGENAEPGLVQDASGNLYGITTYGGGTGCIDHLGCGTFYQITPALK